MDTEWLREWSTGEAEYPPKTLREDVGKLLDAYDNRSYDERSRAEVIALISRQAKRIAELESLIGLMLEAVNFGHAVTPDSRLYRELLEALDSK